MANILLLIGGDFADFGDGTAWINALAALGHTYTESAVNDGFASIDLSDYDIIFRYENTYDSSSPVLKITNPISASKLANWVNAGGRFIGIFDESGTPEGLSWLPTTGLTIDTTIATVMDPQSTPMISNLVATDVDGSVPHLYGYGTFTATGNLAIAVKDNATSRATCIYGAQDAGRVIYTSMITSSTPWNFTNMEHLLLDWLSWIVDGELPAGGSASVEGGTPGVSGADESGFFCPAEGSVVEYSGDADFGAALILDNATGKAYRADRLPFSCAFQVPSFCAGSWEGLEGNYFGTTNGRIAAFGRDNVYADGPWNGCTARLTVTAGAAGSATVSETLPTFGDRLAGMTAFLVKNIGTASQSIQEREIVYSSATKIYVADTISGLGSTWDSNPAAGDVIFLGLIPVTITPQEFHSQRPSYFAGLAIDSVLPAAVDSDDMPIQIDAYQATSGLRRSMKETDYDTAVSTRITTLEEQDRETEIAMSPPDNRHAHAVKLSFWQPPEGAFSIRQMIGRILQ